MNNSGEMGAARGESRYRARATLFFFILIFGLGIAAWHAGFWDARLLTPEAAAPKSPAAIDGPAPARTQAALTPPSFDIVRAEPTGELLAAGRAEPNAEVRVIAGGKVIGKATADEQGEWVILPEKPLAKGNYTVSVEALPKDGTAPVPSESKVAISILGANQKPLVAVTEAAKPTRVLQTPDAPRGADEPAITGAAAQAASIAIAAADYEEDKGSGRLFVSGTAPAGDKVAVYVDNKLAGVAQTGRDGRWALRADRKLSGKSYAVRADLAGGATGSVLARAEIDFTPQLPGVSLGQRADRQSQTAAASGGEEGSLPGANGDQSASQAAGATREVIIRRGDTLWEIASRHYGEGYRYTRIYGSNKGQIRNPNLIYPDQRIILPE